MRYFQVFTLLVFLVPVAVQASIIGGVEFPLGDASFADRVVFYSPGPGVASPYNDPAHALGLPDGSGANAPALGYGGTLIIEFTDNLLVDQSAVEGGLDLYVFERGGATEPFYVSISKDAMDWIPLGKVSGQPTGIDIEPFVDPGDAFRYVRIVDANSYLSNSPFAGADIDAIGAIGSIPSSTVPEPATILIWSLLGSLAIVIGWQWGSLKTDIAEPAS